MATLALLADLMFVAFGDKKEKIPIVLRNPRFPYKESNSILIARIKTVATKMRFSQTSFIFVA